MKKDRLSATKLKCLVAWLLGWPVVTCIRRVAFHAIGIDAGYGVYINIALLIAEILLYVFIWTVIVSWNDILKEKPDES